MPAFPPETQPRDEIGPDHPCGAATLHWISRAGGLTQFGALIEVLAPGSRSAIKHWHAEEDEMVLVLDGTVTLIEGTTEIEMVPGTAATFRAGDPVGHCLENRTDRDTRCLIVGTRATRDRVTYPDHDRVLIREGDTPTWTTAAGQPATNPYRDPPTSGDTT